MAAVASLIVQDVIRRDGLLANVETMGSYLRCRLEQRLISQDYVGDIRGRGLFVAVEFVGNRRSKEPSIRN
jgi:4-aminobutyrate aminotransferase-like enzyme